MSDKPSWLKRLIARYVFRPLAAHVRAALMDEVKAAIVREPLYFGDPARVVMHPTALVNNTLFNTVSGTITLEANATIAHNAMLLTGSHPVEAFDDERIMGFPLEGRDIVVEEGAWIASGAIVLAPCRIGKHAVVAAGAVVVGDVPAYHMVGGVPARVIKKLKGDDTK